ncbi:hypothetical protein QZM26_29645 [Burkholderia multivorans]|uniref:hypothetical protein n=1 Tax=Burkholderia multivorans TaxID=87883 RepID=UPI000CFEA5DA|nr:hypothetical protein [Burkholderia multivorans]MBR7924602.1 hypothetical protein [Burkholderia multivorans]MBU9280837.1 hypothetical protein [Burkholderia multivorans]MBU9576368.1 hypothetical protein [Burkholderia multivorans]MCA8248721.1 hypothetical protein [Burkholderia multivorans]MCL4660302.1 hypothetical protein [Burkholderia multivorans]
MADLNAALVGFIGVLAGGYSSNFLAEDYRRFRDSRALAGALAGELESHGEAIPWIKAGLEKMEEGVRNGTKLNMPEWPIPASPLFDQNASKIGLLGPELARDVAYVYENIRAFRQNFHVLSKNHQNLPPDWSGATLIGCLAAITRAETRGAQLLVNLRNYAGESYWNRPETKTQLKYGVGFLAAFLIVLKMLWPG